jgi:hypothetical protein
MGSTEDASNIITYDIKPLNDIKTQIEIISKGINVPQNVSTAEYIDLMMKQNYMTMQLMSKMCGMLEEIKTDKNKSVMLPQLDTNEQNQFPPGFTYKQQNITSPKSPIDDNVVYYSIHYSIFKNLKNKYDTNPQISYTRFLYNTYSYLSSMMNSTTKTTKYNWLLSDGVFSKYTSPFYVDRAHNIFYIKDPNGKSLIKDPDGREFDRIGNNIIVNSLLECHNEILKSIPENGDEARFNPLYDTGCMNMYTDIAKYKKLVPTYSYLFKLVCKIDDTINANKYQTVYTTTDF